MGKNPRFIVHDLWSICGYLVLFTELIACLFTLRVHSSTSCFVLFKTWQLWGSFTEITPAEIVGTLLCAVVLLKLAE